MPISMTGGYELQNVVMAVIRMLAGITAEPVEEAWCGDGQRIVAAVELSGTSSARLLLETDQSPARTIAARVLALEPAIVAEDDIRDVLGELANVICGNLKETLAPGSTLSIPSVMQGGQCGVEVRVTSAIQRHAFLIDGGMFWVSWIASDGALKETWHEDTCG
jgi:CheY-specific phosphatase CheX